MSWNFSITYFSPSAYWTFLLNLRRESRKPFLLGGEPRSLINWSKLEHPDRASLTELPTVQWPLGDSSFSRWRTTRLDDKILFYRWRGMHSTPRENNWKSIFVESLAFEMHYRIFDNILPEINFVITELTKEMKEGKKKKTRSLYRHQREYNIFCTITRCDPINYGSLFVHACPFSLIFDDDTHITFLKRYNRNPLSYCECLILQIK